MPASPSLQPQSTCKADSKWSVPRQQLGVMLGVVGPLRSLRLDFISNPFKAIHGETVVGRSRSTVLQGKPLAVSFGQDFFLGGATLHLQRERLSVLRVNLEFKQSCQKFFGDLWNLGLRFDALSTSVLDTETEKKTRLCLVPATVGMNESLKEKKHRGLRAQHEC